MNVNEIRVIENGKIPYFFKDIVDKSMHKYTYELSGNPNVILFITTNIEDLKGIDIAKETYIILNDFQLENKNRDEVFEVKMDTSSNINVYCLIQGCTNAKEIFKDITVANLGYKLRSVN